MQKETKEVKRSIDTAFEVLGQEIKKQIEMFDLQPGLSKKEEKLYNDLKRNFEIVQGFIDNEIKDIEKELD